jgi:hypothetical protein
MKSGIYPLVGLVLLTGSLSFAGNLKVPEIPEGEVRVFNSYYATKRDRPNMDNLLMRAVAAFAPESYTGEVHWQGEGKGRQLIYSREAKLNNKATTDLTFIFDTHPDFRLRSYQCVVLSPDGTKLREEYYDYTEPSLRYPDDTFQVFVGDMVLRSSYLEVGVRLPWNVWLSPFNTFPFHYKVIGEEEITVPAGTFDCFKVEGRLVPEGLTDLTGIILSKIVGKYYFWVEKGGSHGVVRIRWPLSSGIVPGVRTRYQTQDLIEVHKGK